MISEREIISRLQAVADDRLSLDAMEDWIADASWGMHRDSADEAIRLASDVLAIFSARDAGFVSPASLRQKLSALASRSRLISIEIAPPNVILVDSERLIDRLLASVADSADRQQRVMASSSLRVSEARVPAIA